MKYILNAITILFVIECTMQICQVFNMWAIMYGLEEIGYEGTFTYDYSTLTGTWTTSIKR